MDFSSALKGLKAGYQLTRPDWDGYCIEITGEPPAICAAFKSGLKPVWLPTSADSLATDWELV